MNAIENERSGTVMDGGNPMKCDKEESTHVITAQSLLVE
jgi:hypothetical protein